MKFNLCISKKYGPFIFFAIGAFFMSFIMALMPWVTGPYWLNVIGTFVCTLILYGVWEWLKKMRRMWAESRNK